MQCSYVQTQCFTACSNGGCYAIFCFGISFGSKKSNLWQIVI